MATSRLCRACGDWHPIDHSWPEGCFSHFKQNFREFQSDFSHPMVISDSMNGIQSMADGKFYESKSELRKGYKAKGVIELGTEAASYRAKEPERPKVTKREVYDALQKVKQGYKPNLPAD